MIPRQYIPTQADTLRFAGCRICEHSQVVGTTRTYPNIDCAPAYALHVRVGSLKQTSRECPVLAIVLQKSKIERDQKFRESRFFDVSTAAKPRSADTMVRGRFLCERMWSLASPLARRISGPRKFCSSPKKDFFNTIGRQSGRSPKRDVILGSVGSKHPGAAQAGGCCMQWNANAFEPMTLWPGIGVMVRSIAGHCSENSAILAPCRSSARPA